jgi:hypothetical protein
MTTYQIQIRGELDARFAGLFEGWDVSRHEGNTDITGQVAGRSGLQRMLERFEDLGLEVVLVRAVESARANREPPEERP